MTLGRLIAALFVLLSLALAPAEAQQPRRALADEIGEGLPQELYRSPYDAVVTELILPADPRVGLTAPFPVTRVRYAAVPFFAFDSAELGSDARRTTANIAELFNDLPDIAAIVIVGHTDSVGSRDYNLALSRRRAEAVQQALVREGVRRDLVKILPLGEAYPLASNATETGRASNRRVEFYVSSVAAAARQAPRANDYRRELQNTHPSCAQRRDPTGCEQPAPGSVQIYNVDGRQDGLIDMSAPITAQSRAIRRPLDAGPVRTRRPLPSPQP